MKSGPSPANEIPETGTAYLDGAFVPFAEARVSLATHALQYGTGVFEGIRAYWNATDGQLYVFRLREHFERMTRSCRIVRIELPGTRTSCQPSSSSCSGATPSRATCTSARSRTRPRAS